mmetsp:Transcript_25592/g.60323  ORF Transcript_25592/g.60323 Transcript_25592/m.60323 type:complete len:135 (-) Transcript_25592:25-429(-)
MSIFVGGSDCCQALVHYGQNKEPSVLVVSRSIDTERSSTRTNSMLQPLQEIKCWFLQKGLRGYKLELKINGPKYHPVKEVGTSMDKTFIANFGNVLVVIGIMQNSNETYWGVRKTRHYHSPYVQEQCNILEMKK